MCSRPYRGLENTDSGDDRFHGRSGPFPIHQRTYDELTPSVRAFIDASENRVTPASTTYTGTGRTVWRHHAQRCLGVRQNTGIAT